MEVKTNLSPVNYHIQNVCRIVNPKQAKLYIKNKVYPIDLYTSLDNQGNDIIVYIFKKEDTQEVYKLWLSHKLN